MEPIGGGTCRAERTGCLCDEPDKTVDCKVIETFGNYVTCTIGVYTCQEDGKWGPCIGERITTPASVSPEQKVTRGQE